MNYLIPLILSGIFITIAHTTLLVRYRANRQWSISEHAVLSRRSLWLYRVSHLITGLLFLWFAWTYFTQVQDLPGFFFMSIWIVLWEWLQALLPAQGRTNKLHTIAALVMWGSFILFGVLCIVFLPVDGVRKLLATALYVLLGLSLVYAITHRQSLYFFQVTMVVLFYSAIIVLVS